MPARRWNDRFYKLLIMIVTALAIVALLIAISFADKQAKEKESELEKIRQERYEQEQQEIKRLELLFGEVKPVLDEYLPGIVCWGDGLTAGVGGSSTTYPKVLKNLIWTMIMDDFAKAESTSPTINTYFIRNSSRFSFPKVLNMGVGGEDTNTILGRNGAVPFVTTREINIPASNDMGVWVTFQSENGKDVAPLYQGDAGLKSVEIAGVEGTLHINGTGNANERYVYYFARSNNGEPVKVPAGTQIITSGSQEGRNYLPIIFMGQHGGYDDVQELISQQKAILEHQTASGERYIIVGLHTGTKESREELEDAMVAEFGDHYINLREYMSTKGMNDAGFAPTENDKNMMARGATPASLLANDGLHFNSAGYTLIGNLIFERMDKLGYFDEVRVAFSNALDE